jgi:hypothetical protein
MGGSIMSNVVVKGNANGTGTVTIETPNTNSDFTISLPATTGTIITTGSSGQSIPTAALPTGSVLQVVNATYSTETSSSSSTYADTGLTATITPKFSTSKILVIVNQNGLEKATNETNVQVRLLRGSTVLMYVDSSAGFTNTSGSWNAVGGVGTNYLDSPATTSPVTYKTQFASRANNGIVYVQYSYNTASTSSITLMEIAA